MHRSPSEENLLHTATTSPNDYQAKLRIPIAVLGIRISNNHLAAIEYLPMDTQTQAPICGLSAKVCEQIKAYLRDPTFQFSLPLKINGTYFQSKVWEAISAIPVSQTLYYSDIARKLFSGPRAVGQACRVNRIPLVIPCHRVIAKDNLGGFNGDHRGASIDIKRWLLRHENA